tara:strand:+ start:393 stop:596 length:204 start_codon:yes stop_codon:yes gene_type:complete
MRVDAAIAEPLRRHRLRAKEVVAGRVRDLMGHVGLPEKLADRVPGQLSAMNVRGLPSRGLWPLIRVS